MARIQAAPRIIRWFSRQLQKRVPYSPTNIFLEGAYAPVSEERSDTTLEVSGEIPRELAGLFTRIGPNPIKVENPGAYYWFLGDGMVHGVRFGEGRALWYRNRWVRTDSAARLLEQARLPGPRHGVSDTVNTNVIGYAGRIWALNEAGVLPVELDDSLDSVRHAYFNSSSIRSFTAHPHTDPDSGELHSVCYEGGPSRTVHYVVIGVDGRVVKKVPVPLSHSPMIHDCAITRSYVLILDLPVTFSGRAFLRGAGLPYQWTPEQGARVGLLPRNGSAGQILWCSVDPCFVYHTCNAYELEDGRVVVDAVVHEKTFDSAPGAPRLQRIRFERWTIDPAAGKVARSVISERQQEFPRFDERRTGKAYRYAYSVGYRPGLSEDQPLFKYDLHTGTVQEHHYGPGRVSGEAVFIPRSKESAEDDGWLLSFVFDASQGRSDLVILNAQDLAAPPQAVVHLPAAVPMGFHSNWIADRG